MTILAERLARRKRLMDAITDCGHDDAVEIMTAYLEELQSGPPQPSYGWIDEEATRWAAFASYEELWAYFVACGRRLRKQRLGQRGRVQLARRVLDGLPASVRRNFAGELLDRCRPEAVA